MLGYRATTHTNFKPLKSLVTVGTTGINIRPNLAGDS